MSVYKSSSDSYDVDACLRRLLSCLFTRSPGSNICENRCFSLAHNGEKVVTQHEVCLQPGSPISLCEASRLLFFFLTLFFFCIWSREAGILQLGLLTNSVSLFLLYYREQVRKKNNENRLKISWILYWRVAVAFTSYLWLRGHERPFGKSISSIFVLTLLNNTLPITARLYWQSSVLHLLTTHQLQLFLVHWFTTLSAWLMSLYAPEM